MILVGLILGFFIWKKTKPAPTSIPSPTQPAAPTIPQSPTPTTPTQPATSTSPTEAILSPPLLPEIATTTVYELTENAQVPTLLSQALAQPLPEKKFVRIAFKKIPDNRFLSLKEFLGALGFSPPEDLFTILEEKATFYLYSASNKTAFGFVAKRMPPDLLSEVLGKEGPQLEDVLKEWEDDIIVKLKLLAILLGKDALQNPVFRDYTYRGYKLRYCDVAKSPDCFGACFSIVGEKLVFSTCCNATVEAINLLVK